MDKDQIFSARIDDLVRRAGNSYLPQLSLFMTMEQSAGLEPRLRAGGLQWGFFGGYEDAERVRLLVGTQTEVFTSDQYELQVVRLTGNLRFAEPNHRDYLGAIMSLGMDRNRFGDVLVTASGCDVLASQEAATLLESASLSVRRVPMDCSVLSLDDWQPPRRQEEAHLHLVQSVRLDAVLAKELSMSRSQATQLIAAGRVQVDHQVTLSAAKECKEGQIVSVKGHGKMRIGSLVGTSKKGKIKLMIYRYQ